MPIRPLSKPSEITKKAVRNRTLNTIVQGLMMPPRPKFKLAYHPKRWDVFVDLEAVLPCIYQFPDEPGLHNVQQGQSLDLHYADIGRRKGWTFIDEQDVEDLEGYDNGYNIPVPSLKSKGGTVYITPWEVAKPGAGTPVPDWKEYQRFVEYCLDNGLVAMPTADQLIERRSELEKLLMTFENRRKGTRETDAERLVKRKIDIIDSYLTAQDEPEVETPDQEPTPTKRRNKVS